MGGLLILAACLIATLLFANPLNPYVWIVIFVMVSFGLIGFTDDLLKLRRGGGNGLSERQKLFWQTLCALAASLVLFGLLGFKTLVEVPFFKTIHVDLHWWGYTMFSTFVIVATSNAVNLTDGMDGLAIGPVMTVGFTYWVFTYVAGNAKFAAYLQIAHVVRAGDIAILCGALVAASLGFLWYNVYPAAMIMGDLGALSLGGALGIVAILAKQELLLPIAGGVFVVEAVSVLIQRYYYKATHQRIFRMAPLHYHFELGGMPETVVVIRFWIFSIVCALVAISALKLR